MKQCRGLVVGVCLGVLFCVLPCAPKVQASTQQAVYPAVYTSAGTVYYNGSDRAPAALFSVQTKTRETSFGYGIDLHMDINQEASYAVCALADVDMFSEAVRQRLRVIVKNSYPAKDLALLRSFASADGLSLSEAIAVSQALIWKYTEGIEVNLSKMSLDARKYYNALERLPNELLPLKETQALNVDVVLTGMRENTRDYRITYPAGTDAAVSHTYSMALAALGVDETVEEKEGMVYVTLQNVPVDCALTMSVGFAQTLPADVYFLKTDEEKQNLLCYMQPLYQDVQTIDFRTLGPSLTIEKNLLNTESLSDAFSFSLCNQNGEVIDTFSLCNTQQKVYTNLPPGMYTLLENPQKAYRFVAHTSAQGSCVASLDAGAVYETTLCISESDTVISSASETQYPLILISMDAYTKQRLPGHVLEIAQDASFTNAQTYVSNSEGEVFVRTGESGVYYVREKEPCFGYEPIETLYEVRINQTDTATVSLEAVPAMQTLTVYSREMGSMQALSGSTVALYTDDAMQEYVGAAVVDESGQAVFQDVVPGVYYLKELSAPKGYSLDDEVHRVEVPVGEQASVLMQNEKRKPLFVSCGALPSGVILLFGSAWFGSALCKRSALVF